MLAPVPTACPGCFRGHAAVNGSTSGCDGGVSSVVPRTVTVQGVAADIGRKTRCRILHAGTVMAMSSGHAGQRPDSERECVSRQRGSAT